MLYTKDTLVTPTPTPSPPTPAPTTPIPTTPTPTTPSPTTPTPSPTTPSPTTPSPTTPSPTTPSPTTPSPTTPSTTSESTTTGPTTLSTPSSNITTSATPKPNTDDPETSADPMITPSIGPTAPPDNTLPTTSTLLTSASDPVSTPSSMSPPTPDSTVSDSSSASSHRPTSPTLPATISSTTQGLVTLSTESMMSEASQPTVGTSMDIVTLTSGTPTTSGTGTTTVTTVTLTTIRTPIPTTLYPGDKLTYDVSMKIVGREFESGMDEPHSEEYWMVYDEMMPWVNISLYMETGSRLVGLHNVTFTNGSVDMEYAFDVSGTDQIRKGQLEHNIIEVFGNNTKYIIRNITIKGPRGLNPQETERLLIAGLVGAMACLIVVIGTAITVLCVRRRCRQRVPRSDMDDKDMEEATSSRGHWTPGTPAGLAYPFSVHDRMWQRSQSMTSSRSWHPDLMAGSSFSTPAVEMAQSNPIPRLRHSPVMEDTDPPYFTYPESRENTTTSVPRGGYSLPTFIGSHGEDLDYWGVNPREAISSDSVPEGFDPPPIELLAANHSIIPSKARRIGRYQRQTSTDTRTTLSRDTTGTQELELQDIIDPDLLKDTSLNQLDDPPDVPDVQRPHADSNVSNDTQSTSTFVLPKFYRDQDTDSTYTGFFISRDFEPDAFELPTGSPMGPNSAIPHVENTRISLRRTHTFDALSPENPPFSVSEDSLDFDSVNSDDLTSLSDGSEPQLQHKQYDSGYDEALKIYWTNPKLDDRPFLQRISQSLSRSAKRHDLIHREPPAYLKAESKKQLSVKGKHKESSNA